MKNILLVQSPVTDMQTDEEHFKMISQLMQQVGEHYYVIHIRQGDSWDIKMLIPSLWDRLYMFFVGIKLRKLIAQGYNSPDKKECEHNWVGAEAGSERCTKCNIVQF